MWTSRIYWCCQDWVNKSRFWYLTSDSKTTTWPSRTQTSMCEVRQDICLSKLDIIEDLVFTPVKKPLLYERNLYHKVFSRFGSRSLDRGLQSWEAAMDWFDIFCLQKWNIVKATQAVDKKPKTLLNICRIQRRIFKAGKNSGRQVN